MPLDFKSIKSLFIIEEENPKKVGETPAKEVKPTVTSEEVTAALVHEAEGGEPGKVSQKFLDVLYAAMENKNLPGLDYLEYKQSLNSLAKMPMDEPVRYQSAFAMAQAMGATPQKLIESANHYIDVLKGEESKFEQALRKQQTEQIGNREQTIQQLDAAIREKAEIIKKLTQEMEQHRQQMEKLTQEIAEATSKVTNTKNNFIASYNTLVAQILGDVENMKKYLK
jgi:hypothetical protein